MSYILLPLIQLAPLLLIITKNILENFVLKK
jgi:hypothetical protein